MKPIKAGYKTAMAAGYDAADKLMKDKGLDAWDEECATLAVNVFNRLIKDEWTVL